MKHSGVFGSVEEWKAALMTLPDNNFFELLRSVFGNIKTPFNKQKLLDDLFNLLSRNEIRKNIAAYIDEQDHKLLAAAGLLHDPSPDELAEFFAGELSRAEVQSLLLNLEERLILYRFRDENILRLSLNPVLETVLAPFVADYRCLFPSVDESRARDEPSIGHTSGGFTSGGRMSEGRTLAALFTFLSGEEEPLKVENGNGTGTEFRGFREFRGLRKKTIEDGKKIFPGLDLEMAVKVFLALELFRIEDRNLAPERERLEEYGGLSPLERAVYWTAGLYLCLSGGNDDPDGQFYRGRLRQAASLVRRFLDLVEPEKSYPEITLRRFWELLEREDRSSAYVWGSPVSGGGTSFPFGPFLAAADTTGLLARTGSHWKRASPPSDETQNDSVDKNQKPVIVMDTAFSFILYPEISFADTLALGTFCSVKVPNGETRAEGSAVCFELTRTSAVRGFDQGASSAGMIKLLERLSGNRLDSNLGWTLKEWESRYDSVALHQGIVLCLAEDRRYLAEAGPIASLVRRTLAPGIYMISSADRTEAAKALRKAGVDIIAQPPSGSGSPSFSRTGRSSVFAGSGGRLRGHLSGYAASGSFLSLLKTNGERAGENSEAVHDETNAAGNQAKVSQSSGKDTAFGR